MSLRRRKPIPIPSFGIEEDHPEEEPPAVKLKLPISKANLVQVDCALHLYLNKNKETSITYTAFCKHLVPKLILQSPATPSENDHEIPSWIRNLSNAERLWHDLHCVLVPKLYKTRPSDTEGGILERQEITANRMAVLREQIDEAIGDGVSKQVSDSVGKEFKLQSEKKEKLSKAKALKLKENDREKKNAASALIKPGMTVEERVRARAVLRDLALQKVESNKEQDTATDLVKVADKIFSRARHVLRNSRNKNLQHRKVSSSSTICVILLQDLLPALPDMTREEVARSLESLEQASPGWIRWKNPARTKTKTMHKRATIWLETANYKQVRRQLMGPSKNSAILETPPGNDHSKPEGVAAVTLSGKKRSSASDSWKFSKLQLNNVEKKKHRTGRS